MVVKCKACWTANKCADTWAQIEISVQRSWVLRNIVQEDIMRKIIDRVVCN